MVGHHMGGALSAWRWSVGAVAVALLFAMSGGVRAQETVDASLGGRITDAKTGRPIPGAAVIATSGFGASVAETDAAGDYRIPFLKPGSYNVRVEATGYGTIVQTDITLSLGERQTLNLALAPGQVEKVTVTGEAPLLDRTTTTVGANITQDLLEAIPIGRTLQSIFYLAPGVNSSLPAELEPPVTRALGGANPAISGGGGLENQFLVDGINITNASSGALGTVDGVFGSRGTSINVDFIKEVRVMTGGFEPEFAQSLGGIVNAVTRSGGNSFSGELFYYVTARGLEGNRRVLESGIGDVNVAQDGLQSNDFGFTVGGPFVRDRLFGYAAYNRVETVMDLFGAQSGATFAFDQDHPARREFHSNNWSAKLTWQIAPGHRLEASGFGDPSRQPFGPNRDQPLLSPSGDRLAYTTLDFGGENLILRYTGVATPSFFVEASAARAKNRFEELIPTEGNQPLIRDYRSGVGLQQLGGVGSFDVRNVANDQFLVKLTSYIGGKHELKYGLQYEKSTGAWTLGITGDNYMIDPSRPGVGGRRTTTGLAAGLFCVPGRDTGDPNCPGSSSYLLTGSSLGDPTDRPASQYRALFVQDLWQVTPHFALKYGVRFEKQTIGGSRGDYTFDGSLAPRVGFTWDPGHKGKSKLHGSLGRFYEKIPSQGIAFIQLTERALVYGYYYFTPPTTDTNGDGVVNAVDGVPGSLVNPVPGKFSILAPPANQRIDPGLEASFADELVLGYEREIRPSMAIGGRVIYRRLGKVLDDVQHNFASEIGTGTVAPTPLHLMNPGTDTPAYHGPFHTSLGNPCTSLNFPGFFAFDPGDFNGSGTVNGDDVCLPASVESAFPEPERKYVALELTFDKRLLDRWQLLASYRLSRLSGNYEGSFDSDLGVFIVTPNSTIAYDAPDEPFLDFTYRSGVLPTDRTHIVRLNGSYWFRFGGTLGASWNILSGAPLTIMDIKGFLSRDLPERRGGSGRTPTQNVVDLHFDYPVRLGKGDLKLFVDVFNLFDEDTDTTFRFVRMFNATTMNPGFGSVSGTLPPRSVRLGAKFQF